MRLTSKDWQNPENLMWIKLGSIHMIDEGYRTFLSKALRKLAYYEDLEEELKDSEIDTQPTAYSKPTKISNEVVTLSNYATEDLDKILAEYGDVGYKLVSTNLAPNRFNVEIMYLFFAKEDF